MIDLHFFGTVNPKRCGIPRREQAEAALVPPAGVEGKLGAVCCSFPSSFPITGLSVTLSFLKAALQGNNICKMHTLECLYLNQSERDFSDNVNMTSRDYIKFISNEKEQEEKSLCGAGRIMGSKTSTERV